MFVCVRQVVGFLHHNFRGFFVGDFTGGGVGRSIVWGADSPGGLFVSETYRDEKRRGNMIRVRMNTDEKIIDETAGELITTQWA